MAIDIHSQIILSDELHVPKGFTEASTDQVPSKNSIGELEWVDTDGFSGPQGPAGAPGSLAIFDVVDASNPVELNTISDVDFGTELIVRQAIAGSIDIQTFYVYDSDASTIPVDGLYAVTTSMGGNTRWIAGTGAYGYAGPISTATGERFVTTKEQELIGISGSTGLHDGAALSVGATVGTFDISAGHGFYSDITTDYSNADSNDVVITARINIPVTNILTQPVTYISIDRTDAIIQSIAYPTSSERRDAIFLGVVVHSDNTNVQFVNNLPDTSLDTTSQVHDIMTGLGFFNISGNIISPNDSNLSFNKSAGKAFKQGANFQINKKDPHTLSLIAKVLSSFRYRNQDSTEGLDITVIDPTTYDLAGTTTTVSANNNATIQRLYVFPSNEIRIQRGQEVYANLADAVDAIGKESFNIESNIEENGLLLASIAVKKIATDLSLLSDAQIFIASRFGELGSVGSSAVGTLQQGYDNSVNPEILTNTTLGAVTLKRGSALDADDVLEVKDGADAQNFSVTGEGRTSTKSLKLTGVTIVNDISIDGTLTANSDAQIPTQKAVKTYVDANAGGASDFVSLTDTPADYTAASLQSVRVNVGETALEFFTPAAGGSGDVVGPVSSTDNAIARYDLATGKLLQDSNVLIDDDGRISVESGESVFIGRDAGLNDDLTANWNVGVGVDALKANTTGKQNVAFGKGSLMSNTAGTNNTSIGYLALTNATDSENTAVGQRALSNADSQRNTAVGSSSLSGVTTGRRNTGFGYSTDSGNNLGDNNVAIGYSSGANSSFLISNRANNVFVGAETGRTVTTGSDNILLGYGIDTPTPTTNNFMSLGGAVQADLLTGNVGLGTATPTNKLELKGSLAKTITGTTAISGGTSTMTGSGTSYLSELSIGCAVDIIGEIFTVTAIGSDTNATLDSNHSVGTGFVAITTDEDMLKITSGDDGALFRVDGIGSIYAHAIKKGTSQALAGANVDELWVDTATNAIKIGV